MIHLNTAVYFSRLTQPLPVKTHYYTGVGQDKFSQKMLNQWEDEGLCIQNIVVSEHHIPGIYIIETSPDGERQFLYRRKNIG